MKPIPAIALVGALLHYGGVETIGDRLRHALGLAGMGVNAADRAVEQGEGYTSRLVNNKKRRPDPAILQRYADKLGLRVEWIMTGRLPMKLTAEDANESHFDRGTRLFLALFAGTESMDADAYVAEKMSEAARLPGAWAAHEVMQYWVNGFSTWKAMRRGKAVPVVAAVEEMDEDEATPAFARKRAAK